MNFEFYLKILITKCQPHFPFLLSQTLKAVTHNSVRDSGEFVLLHTIEDKGKTSTDHWLIQAS